MKTITQYREDINRLLKKVGEIDARATNEDRNLSEEEISFKNEMLDGVDELRKIITTQERHAKLQYELDQPENAETVENRRADSRIEHHESGDRERFSSLGAQLSAVMRAGVPGGQTDPRLRNTRSTGLGETVPSDGGFLVQQDFSNDLLQDVFETGILASRCKRVPISGNANSIKINGMDETSRASTRYGGIKGYWADEAEEKTASKPKFRKIELNLKKLIGLCYATDELLEDAGALEGIIRSSFVGEFGFLIDDAIIRGNGAGQPLGVLNAGSLVAVDHVSSQGEGTLVPENIFSMWARLFPQSQQNSVWLINQALQPALLGLKYEDNNTIYPVYLPPGGLSASPYGSLLGRPVIPIEQCSAPNTQGDIILADFGSGYILAEKGGIKSDMSIHVRFIYDESVFRFVMRIDGQPVRATTLTPYQGTATLSHFVTLTGSREGA